MVQAVGTTWAEGGDLDLRPEHHVGLWPFSLQRSPRKQASGLVIHSARGLFISVGGLSAYLLLFLFVGTCMEQMA